VLLHNYPIEVAVGADGRADVEFDGGVGYIPVTFTGLIPGRAYAMRPAASDFWQADTVGQDRRLERTYNVRASGDTHSGKSTRVSFH
jgi:hypothetical protein